MLVEKNNTKLGSSKIFVDDVGHNCNKNMNSDSSDEEAIPRGRRRPGIISTPKNLPRKKVKESPLTDNNAQRHRKGKAGAKKYSSDSDSSAGDFRDSSPASIENHPPNKNVGRKKKEQADRNAEDQIQDVHSESSQDWVNDDENEKQMRQRRRLSRSLTGADAGFNRSLNVSTGEGNAVIVPDRAGLRSIYSSCIELFQAHKITQKNAFSLKLLECLDAIINGPDFDKNDMHMVGRTLEVGTRIYVCRVENTHSEVMHLASDITVHNNKLKEKNKGREPGEGEEGENVDNENDEPAANRRAVKKKKRSRFVEEDESKLCTDFEGQSTKYVTRRTTLKKKFTRMVNEEIDFDYISYFIGADEPHPLQNDDGDDGDAETLLPKNAVNAEEMKRFEFLDFNLLNNFDPAGFDVWGKPLNNDANISECQQGDVLPVDEDFAYNPENRPQDYTEDVGLDDGDDDLNISQHYANEAIEGAAEANVNANEPIAINRISSLDQLSSYFSAIKNIQQMTKEGYGWAGPQFFQPRRNWIKAPIDPNKAKKGRKKRVAIDVSYDNVDWRSDENKYISTSKERTVLDERTVEKWSFTKTAVPYLGIESAGYDEDDDLTDAFSNVALEDEDSPDFVHPLLRFFIDPNRNIESLLKDEIQKYGSLRDAGEFANEKGEYPDDSYVPYDDAELSARDNEVSFCASNGLLNGEPLDEANRQMVAENDDPLATLAGIFPASMGLNFEDDFMSKATEATDSIKFTKKPKPVDMHALKSSVLRILKDKLFMDETGGPTKDTDTSTTLFELLQKVFQNADQKVVENLSIPIIVVALMHVVADQKLFMLPGKVDQMDNPVIVCRGNLWEHKNHIPGGALPPHNPHDEEDE